MTLPMWSLYEYQKKTLVEFKAKLFYQNKTFFNKLHIPQKHITTTYNFSVDYCVVVYVKQH